MSKDGMMKIYMGGKFGKDEKKRWFVLSGENVVYYKEKNLKEKAGEFSLKDGSVEIQKDGKKRYVEVKCKDGTTQCLQPDEEEVDGWVKALKDGCGKKPAVSDFDLLNVIGKGSFGKVMQVRKKNGKDKGQIYAMKVLSKKHIVANNEIEHTKSERNILERLKHPFLMNLVYSFQTDDKLYFILEFVNGGELFHHLQKDKRFDEKRVQLYAAEILLAVEYLHENGVIYRDLKPENLLLTETGHIKVTDFGLCKEGMEDEEDRTSTFCGTPEYLAPEVLKGQGYTKIVDWWSFGSLVYEMLVGLPPFYSQDVQEMYRKIMTEPLKFPDSVSPAAKELLSDLLVRDLSKRLGDPEKMKKYAFFKGMDWEKLYKLEIKPTFVPEVASKEDVGQVDETFLCEKPNLDLDDEEQEPVSIKKGEFSGFTFDGASVMAKK